MFRLHQIHLSFRTMLMPYQFVALHFIFWFPNTQETINHGRLVYLFDNIAKMHIDVRIASPNPSRHMYFEYSVQKIAVSATCNV